MSQKERKRERERERKRGLICEVVVVESGSFQMDFKRKARRADDDEESETRCLFSPSVISIISSSSSSVFDRRFTKTCEGANMANHLCYPGARYRYRSYFSIFTFYTACSERFETHASRVLRATVWFLPQNRRRPRWVRNRRFLLLHEMVAVRCQGTTTFLASRRRRLWRRVCFALANRI